MTALLRSAKALHTTAETPYPRLRMINGAVIEFRSWEREQNLMGPTILGGVVDEAGLLTPSAHAAISSRRSGTLGPLRYIGNPGVQTGPFRKLCSRGEQARTPGSEWAGVVSLHRWTWRDKYAAIAEKDQAAARAYESFIREEKESLIDVEYRRLYEAEWTEDEAAVFRGLPDPDGAPLAGPADGESYVVGVDVAQQTDYLVATILGTKRNRIDSMARWRGIPYPQSADRLAEISRAWNNATLVIETNGPGLPLYQEIQQRGISCTPFTTTGPSKEKIIARLAMQLQQGGLALADVPPLHEELRSYRYERLAGGGYRYGAPAGEHDDCVMSLAFAVWGATRGLGDLSAYGWLT